MTCPCVLIADLTSRGQFHGTSRSFLAFSDSRLNGAFPHVNPRASSQKKRRPGLPRAFQSHQLRRLRAEQRLPAALAAAAAATTVAAAAATTTVAATAATITATTTVATAAAAITTTAATIFTIFSFFSYNRTTIQITVV